MTHQPRARVTCLRSCVLAQRVENHKSKTRNQKIKIKIKSQWPTNQEPGWRVCPAAYLLNELQFGFLENWDPPNSAFLLCCTRLSVGMLVLVIAWVCPFWCLVPPEQVTSSFSPELLISSPHRQTLARIPKRKFKCLKNMTHWVILEDGYFSS